MLRQTDGNLEGLGGTPEAVEVDETSQDLVHHVYRTHTQRLGCEWRPLGRRIRAASNPCSAQ
eukprot:5450488-Prymnesium_polylepis.1